MTEVIGWVTRLSLHDQLGHAVRVYYTNDDDGIHVGCEPCNWEAVLGFWPHPADIASQYLEHIDG